ncbi:SDR family NAD(P)-dependent oxidoreductase [Luteococcus sp. Sow4_B9]|uniref:SDR family NAD(P)-dependent oxidoreductase n=1 Tax=Luteococcus sp. Sow4_B9 TaxID=3438792 RepID=UPI003F9DE3B2
MESSVDPHRQVQIATIRALLARDGRLPVLRAVAEEAAEEGTADWQLGPIHGEPPVEAWRERLQQVRSQQGEPCSVAIDGVGRYRIDWPATSIDSTQANSTQANSMAGPMAGKVALVTGAAQGFGLGIAQGLAARGVVVALADLNHDGVLAAAEQIRAEHGEWQAIGLRMDVADPESTRAGVAEVVQAFGGLDLFVANAGVVRAGAVTELSVDDFDLVTRVNYRGYFVGVQAVVPVMAAQHRAAPAHRFDIVEVNSKSGLAGSNRNAPYAGSKFGGIGLTQSFALELAGQGIKVNAVCPGNYLDGPLWSDPDDGLFVQYLRAGKVPGATTVEDVRNFYQAKVPLGRGCRPDDVVKAICYAVDQDYETGQAIPVTGGQTMLH